METRWMLLERRIEALEDVVCDREDHTLQEEIDQLERRLNVATHALHDLVVRYTPSNPHPGAPHGKS